MNIKHVVGAALALKAEVAFGKVTNSEELTDIIMSKLLEAYRFRVKSQTSDSNFDSLHDSVAQIILGFADVDMQKVWNTEVVASKVEVHLKNNFNIIEI